MSKADILGNTLFTGKLIFGNEVLQSFAEERTIQFFVDDAASLVEELEEDLNDPSMTSMIEYVEEIADEPEGFEDFIANNPISIVSITGSQFYGFRAEVDRNRTNTSKRVIADLNERELKNLLAEADEYSNLLGKGLSNFEEQLTLLKEIHTSLNRTVSEE